MDYKYSFTIFTPCYNSEKFIHRVYTSLLHQTCKDFEWLVINDGSTDNTSIIIQQFIKEAPFDVQFFDLPQNQMLTKNYNLAIKNAKGKFFIPIGHDDEFIPKTIETFIKYWVKFGHNSYSGISCLCIDQQGNLVGDKFPQSPYFSNYIDVVYNVKIMGEKWGFTRTEIMKEFLLPEDIDVYISEGLIWSSIGAKYQTIYINEPLRIYFVNQPNYQNLSSVNKKRIQYPKGGAFYYLQMINHFKGKINGNISLKIKFFLNYIRLSYLSKKNTIYIIKDIKFITDKLVALILIPIGFLLQFKK